MRNGLLLVLLAGCAVLNGLDMDRLPAWRQALFAALVVAAHLHGRHLPVRRDVVLLAAVALPAAGYAVIDVSAGAGALLALGVFVTLPWLAGRFRRQQADLVRAGRERVAHLERERQFVADRARLRERARFAADMHDAIGHELALIALRAGALELGPDVTEADRETAAQLRASAVAATDRLRRTVHQLRTTSDPAVDQSVDALVRRARAAGMTVHLRSTVDGVTAPTTDRAVYRVVQEALTNAARHAPGADVDVRIEPVGDTIAVTVRNPVARPPAPAGTGTGIATLREHVELIGGTVHAHAGEGAFTVTAHLPAAPATGVERR
ncbi:histidine kinase [Micromonospora sp. R77]|uniref:sensor histidine kinase n=1 Tax=Micromonospora sp. R77 TaxID=2925836 RepID=UPI001F606457|nr:histidine kinase [Micromonospora sp. R77]MCI4061161.1 histidine kinase [Micromonospora sp. R77]